MREFILALLRGNRASVLAEIVKRFGPGGSAFLTDEQADSIAADICSRFLTETVNPVAIERRRELLEAVYGLTDDAGLAREDLYEAIQGMFGVDLSAAPELRLKSFQEMAREEVPAAAAQVFAWIMRQRSAPSRAM
jgi:hypothetical protein